MKADSRSAPPAADLAWAYFLDLDGTLIEFAEHPEAVLVEQALPELIGDLHRASGGAVAVVSGRLISDLQARLGLRTVPLAGLHGLERRDASGRLWLHAAPPEAKCALQAVLAPVLARHPGLLLEDKGLTLALHYRRAPQLGSTVHRLMRRLLASAGGDLVLQQGKYVVELRPGGFDKGTAIAEYLAEPPFAGRRPVFIGDDVTDEAGFACVNAVDGISIKVGNGPSAARHRLPDVTAVRHWLGQAMKGMS